jgi:hypothetical protein
MATGPADARGRPLVHGHIDIMKTMKRLAFLLGCSCALMSGAELSGVRSVYVLPMSRGLDQYLANRLTNEHTFQVVTDPKMADAVFTDHLGESFQNQMETMYPPPPPPPPVKVEADVNDKGEKSEKGEKKDKKKQADDAKGLGLITDTVNKLSNPALTSGFGRAKGTVFLVDAKSHQVVWSTFEPPKGTANNDLDRTASDIVNRIKKDLNPGSNPKTKN